ncbi:MAG: flagellar hook basal-body protein [Clostridiales bacterium]|nr:flagellar hook basal-body protein [Clostridiales bacterium]
MLSGFYTIASGMLTNQRNIDTIGNNLVNLQTPGYRTERLIGTSFEMELMIRREQQGIEVLGDGIGASAAVVGDVVTIFDGGTLSPTDRPLDVAINGEGFFNIAGAGGINYLTRNGGFDIDEEGYLILSGLGRVLGENGEIHVETSDISIRGDGSIENSQGEVIARLLVSAPEENTILERQTNGMFTSNTPLAAAENYEIIQNYLELSNSDMNREMTNLLAAQRAFQSCSSALQIIDGLDRKAATQIASIS